MKISLNGHDAVVCIDRWSNATIVVCKQTSRFKNGYTFDNFAYDIYTPISSGLYYANQNPPRSNKLLSIVERINIEVIE